MLEEKLRRSHRRNFLMKPLRLVTDYWDTADDVEDGYAAGHT